MGKPIGSFVRHRGGFAIAVALALCCCTPVLAAAPAGGGPPAAAITEITIERDCFGCATGSILVLRRDGTASFTVTGKARHGTENRTSSGAVRVEDFEKLSRFIVAQGFFDLKEQYEESQIRDGAWTTTSVVRGGQDKRVFRREGAGPAALKAVEAAIDALKSRIDFVPKPQ
jgi:hypothetical protein